jgi:hypothetical protein
MKSSRPVDSSEREEIRFYEFLFSLAEYPPLPPLGEAAMPELPNGLVYNDELQPAVNCCMCGQLFEWPCDVSEYDPDCSEHHYCGGSPRCCP